MIFKKKNNEVITVIEGKHGKLSSSCLQVGNLGNKMSARMQLHLQVFFDPKNGAVYAFIPRTPACKAKVHKQNKRFFKVVKPCKLLSC
jgi:hypothetical protein